MQLYLSQYAQYLTCGPHLPMQFNTMGQITVLYCAAYFEILLLSMARKDAFASARLMRSPAVNVKTLLAAVSAESSTHVLSQQPSSALSVALNTANAGLRWTAAIAR
ncbi:hypothetical protein M513_11389 [Trichuris suis]|uniref:Uncharacterized protein n=1 Tax=Trichuris suis TaxID=68888 RepID=A0A085LIT5_9BILA|nr:hypothetical protein M513_14242 [Trichuris suis]KFD47711.1 hypothetical protein M513_11389 [Trichuris suis]